MVTTHVEYHEFCLQKSPRWQICIGLFGRGNESWTVFLINTKLPGIVEKMFRCFDLRWCWTNCSNLGEVWVKFGWGLGFRSVAVQPILSYIRNHLLWETFWLHRPYSVSTGWIYSVTRTGLTLGFWRIVLYYVQTPQRFWNRKKIVLTF